MMAKQGFGIVLLFGLVNASLPLLAQSVSLKVCNAGKSGVDAFVQTSGKVSNSQVGPADCATVAQTKGAMQPTYIGFAFADSKGQWGATHRIDLVPDFGSIQDDNALAALGALLGQRPRAPSGPPQRILTSANQTVSVRHANRDVSVQLQLFLRPPVPTCRNVGGPSHAAQDNLPYNATSGQRAIAASTDAANSTPVQTICDDFVYTLNVEAYPDTRELTFLQECDPCDKKADAQVTPEERAADRRRAAAANSVINSLSGLGGLGGVFGGIVDQGRQDAKEEQKAREARLKPPQPVIWSDLLPAMARTGPASGLPPEIPRNIMIRGTVERILEAPANATEHWVDVFFKESNDGMFDVCALSPAIFEDAFGPSFRTAIIGKPVEVEGELRRDYCKGSRGAIRVTLAHQAHPAPSAQFDLTLVPKIVHPAPPPPTPVNTEDPYDPTMPSYSVTSELATRQLTQYCTGMYNPFDSLLTQEQNKFKYANRAAIEAEVQKCVSQFNGAEVAAHRRIAMRYCLGNNNFTGAGKAALATAYDQCMAQNDPLTVFCTVELKYRGVLNHMPNIAEHICPSPRPTGREVLVILNGGHADAGRPVVIPTTGPGLPAILLAPMDVGILQRSVPTIALKPAAAPAAPTAPATTSAPAAAATTPAAQAAAEAKAAREKRNAESRQEAQQVRACLQQLAMDYPDRGRSDRAGYLKALAACNNPNQPAQ